MLIVLALALRRLRADRHGSARAPPDAPGARAPTAPPLPANVEPPPPAVNLSGFPLPYRQGYADGCASATGAERKDAARFARRRQLPHGLAGRPRAVPKEMTRGDRADDRRVRAAAAGDEAVPLASRRAARPRHHVLTWGDPAAPKLFLLHGWMDVAASFQFLVDAFARDWYVIAPDLRGYGQSAWQPQGYWFADYIADLEALLRRVRARRERSISSATASAATS